MVKSIRWNKRALDTFYETASYLEENFSEKVANNFVESVFEKIETIKKHPDIGRKAPKRKTVRFILVGKHKRLYYRLAGRRIIISSIFDTRQHPNKDIHQ